MRNFNFQRWAAFPRRLINDLSDLRSDDQSAGGQRRRRDRRGSRRVGAQQPSGRGGLDGAGARARANTPLVTLQADAATWMGAEARNGDIQQPAVTVTPGSGELSISASGTVETTIAEVTGVQTIPVSASATTKWGLSHVELALVLDNTGSMSSSNKLPTLISVNTLSTTARTDPSALKISVVPFSMTVNVGSGFQNASWVTGVMPRRTSQTAAAPPTTTT
jgi:hypothetical protein